MLLPFVFADFVQEAQNHPSLQCDGSYLLSTEGVTAWATVVTAVATIVYVIVSWGMLRAIKRQADIAEDTAKRQLRAYMGLKSAKLYIDETGGVTASLELRNCGQTPAYDFQGAHIARSSSYPVLAPGIPPPDLRKSSSIIGAGLAYHILGNRIGPGEETREQLIDTLSTTKDLVFCINGCYSYRDIFNDRHYIKFQQIIGGPSGVVRTDKDDSGLFATFSNDSEGNEAD